MNNFHGPEEQEEEEEIEEAPEINTDPPNPSTREDISPYPDYADIIYNDEE